MSEVVMYKCNVNGCQQITKNAISFKLDMDTDDNSYILYFSPDPKMFPFHACTFLHLNEFLAKETDKIERTGIKTKNEEIENEITKRKILE